jgi:pre-mRNA-splicing factor 38A
LIDTFLEQDHFKYVRALGAFYLRLTGRPQDIYEKLEPLYSNCSKLKYRDVTEWRLIHVDEFIDELLTKSYACGIALPRLPKRSTLQDAGYLDDGPRPTALKPMLEDAGGVKEYLKIKVDVEQSTGRKEGGVDHDGTYTATVLWEKRFGKMKQQRRSPQREEGEKLDTSSLSPGGGQTVTVPANTKNETTDLTDSDDNNLKRKADHDHDKAPKKPKKKGMKKGKYGGTLFKKSKAEGSEEEELKSACGETTKSSSANSGNDESNRHKEGSEEYWNEQRARLGLKPLK